MLLFSFVPLITGNARFHHIQTTPWVGHGICRTQWTQTGVQYNLLQWTFTHNNNLLTNKCDLQWDRLGHTAWFANDWSKHESSGITMLSSQILSTHQYTLHQSHPQYEGTGETWAWIVDLFGIFLLFFSLGQPSIQFTLVQTNQHPSYNSNWYNYINNKTKLNTWVFCSRSQKANTTISHKSGLSLISFSTNIINNGLCWTYWTKSRCDL